MATLNFPSNPVNGQSVTFDNTNYIFDGEKWKSQGLGYNPFLDSKVVSKEALRRTYAEAGYNLVNGSFEQGGTLTAETDVLLQKATGGVYAWTGTLPKAVAPGTDPALPGSGYAQQTDAVLRGQIQSATGPDIGYSRLATILRSLYALAGDFRNIRDLGAIGDGVLHPLSEKFSTLADAQFIYPHATSLSDSIDWCAIQLAYHTGGKWFVPVGHYVCNLGLVTTYWTHLVGANSNTYTTDILESPLSGSIIRFTSDVTDQCVKVKSGINKNGLTDIGIVGDRGAGPIGILVENQTRELTLDRVSIHSCHTGFKGGDFWFSKAAFISVNDCDVGLHLASGGTLVEFDTVILQGYSSSQMTQPILINGDMDSATPAPISTLRQQLKIRNLVMQNVTTDSLFQINSECRQLIVETMHIEASTWNYLVGFATTTPYRILLKFKDVYIGDGATRPALIKSSTPINGGDLTIDLNQITGFDTLKFTNLFDYGGVIANFDFNTISIIGAKLYGTYGLRNLVTNFDANVGDLIGKMDVPGLKEITYNGQIINFESASLYIPTGSATSYVSFDVINKLQSSAATYGNGTTQTIEYHNISTGSAMNVVVDIRIASSATASTLYSMRNGAVTTDPNMQITASIESGKLKLVIGPSIGAAGASTYMRVKF